MTRSGGWIAAMVLLAAVCAAVAGPVAFVAAQAFGPATTRPLRNPPAAAPSNLCGLLHPDLVERLVPHHKPPETARYRSATRPSARCHVDTDGPSAPTLAAASLDVFLDRFGGEATAELSSAIERCGQDRATGTDRTVSVRDVADVGERACVSVETGPFDRWHPIVFLAAVRGRDLVRVSYSAGPMDAAVAEKAVMVVASEVFRQL